jgi:serine/threonine protein kinase
VEPTHDAIPDLSEIAVAERMGGYDLLRRLGVGGMAEVHLARATGIEGFQKLVVLKQILPSLSADPHFVQMFLSEARLAAILDHPNIVQVFDLGKDDDDYFFTMEYVYGETLQTLLGAIRDSRLGRVPYEHVVSLGIGVAAGLHYAHERVGFDGRPLGLVHRDVSPSNVMITYDGNVKVTDFGIAKVVTRTDVTMAGVRKGKIPYMSPEQCLAQPLDRRSDIYSLGIVMYEAATMSRLFDGDNEFGVMNRIVNEDVPPPSSRQKGFPKELERIILKALAREPARRYATALELQRDLEAFARERRLDATPSNLGQLMHALFAPRPFPWGALMDGGPSVSGPQNLVTSEGSASSLGADGSGSMPGARQTSDMTGAGAAPHVGFASESRIWHADEDTRTQQVLRRVFIGLGITAAMSVLVAAGLWVGLQVGGRTTAATPDAESGPAVDPAAAAPAAVAPEPSPVVPEPSEAEPAGASSDPSIAADEAEAEAEPDEEILVLDEVDEQPPATPSDEDTEAEPPRRQSVEEDQPDADAESGRQGRRPEAADDERDRARDDEAPKRERDPEDAPAEDAPEDAPNLDAFMPG